MQIQWLAFLTGFTILYALINFYLFTRCWQIWGVRYFPKYRLPYLFVFSSIASTFFMSRVGEVFLPSILFNILYLVGVYWLAILYYGVLLLLLIDSIRFVDRYIPFIPNLIKIHSQRISWIGLLTLVVLLTYGTWNAKNPVIQHYDVNINKQVDEMESLHIVMVSDIHLGSLIDKARLEEMVARVNCLEPQVIILAGDIIDGNIHPFLDQDMQESLHKLKAPLGVYAVLGNHEYMNRNPDQILSAYSEAGMIVLRDQHWDLNGIITIIGRDDRSSARLTNKPRKTVHELLQGVNLEKPLLVIDHQPFDLQEAKDAGIDLQLSGHTHRGQFFPNQFITSRLYEIDWGYMKKDNFSVIVSCGYGTWGPPIRIGNAPEIVDVHVHFLPHRNN